MKLFRDDDEYFDSDVYGLTESREHPYSLLVPYECESRDDVTPNLWVDGRFRYDRPCECSWRSPAQADAALATKCVR